jgi:hypothetical protein
MDVHRAIGDWMMATQADGTFLVILGLPLTVISAVLMLRGDRGPGGPVVLDEMRRFKYATWGLLPAGGGPDVAGQLETYWRRLASTTGLAGGLAILLAGLAVSTAVRFGAAGALQAAHVALWVWQPLMYLALMVGTGVGYPIAMRLSRRRGPDGPGMPTCASAASPTTARPPCAGRVWRSLLSPVSRRPSPRWSGVGGRCWSYRRRSSCASR